jgi:hypothetical protein
MLKMQLENKGKCWSYLKPSLRRIIGVAESTLFGSRAGKKKTVAEGSR